MLTVLSSTSFDTISLDLDLTMEKFAYVDINSMKCI